MTDKRVVLITGASSGMGRAIAMQLAGEGYRVFGTSRRLQSGSAAGAIEMTALDTTSEESVRACINTVLDRASRIDVLINNAGRLLLGAAEETDLEEMQAVFATNYWGTVRMIKAVLPHMRHQGFGHIFNNTGLAGFIGTPYMSAYCASKHAVEGYSEALDHEVRSFGVRVSLLEPGFVNTAFGSHRSNAHAPMELYGETKDVFLKRLQQHSLDGMSPEAVARRVSDVLSQRSYRLRYPVGGEARLLSLLRSYLPAGMFDQRMRKAFKLD